MPTSPLAPSTEPEPTRPPSLPEAPVDPAPPESAGAADEDRVRQGEERFRLLLEHSSEGILLAAADGRLFFATETAASILGRPLEILVGASLDTIVHPDEHDRFAWHFAEALERPGTPVRLECRVPHAERGLRHLDLVLVNRLDTPSICAVVVNFRDVTAERQLARALDESEERFRTVFASAPIGIVQLDLEGRIVDANAAVAEMSLWPLEELRGRSLQELVHPDHRAAAERELRELVAGERDRYQAERLYVRKDGSSASMNVTVALVRDALGRASACTALLENVSERRQTEEALRESNRQLSQWVGQLEQRTREISLLSEMGDMLQACKTPAEACSVIPAMAAQLFPAHAGAVSILSTSPGLLEVAAPWGGFAGERLFSVDECWALRRGRPHEVAAGRQGLACRHMQHAGEVPCICVPMMAHGELLGLFTVSLQDGERSIDASRRLALTVAEHVALALANLKLHETLRSQSIRDPVTGLFNRRYMEESLEREMRRATRNRRPVGIIMLDIDHFKQFNDVHGHGAGDTLLREVGAILQRSVRAEDIACRYGGEEFTLILPEASLSEAAHRAEHLRQAIGSLRVQYRRQPLGPITISAGVAIYPDHGPTGDMVLRAADAALYQAKARGRDRVAVNQGSGLFGEAIVEFAEN